MPDADFTLAALRPLIQEQKATGRRLVVRFACPVSGTTVSARWQAPREDANSAMNTLKRRARRTLWWELRRQVMRMILGLLGRGAMGRVASQVAGSALHAHQRARSRPGARTLSQEEIDQGTCEAFASVSSHFAWIKGEWVHASAAGIVLSPFEKQLHSAPITETYDRTLVARMLVEVANAHHGINDTEKMQLSEMIDPDLGSLKALQERPPLSFAELSEASTGGVRTSMFALAWSLALCDEDLDRQEEFVLDRFAQGLGLTTSEEARCRALAQGYLIEQALERAFTWSTHDQAARDMLIALGQQIGMTREEVELAEARFQKRRG